ncbi:hypothetical protein J1614_011135 [Plenodomus biglobosus]|nr:hypothetical protein J1614_011135 [Plenodomus biglobosus]
MLPRPHNIAAPPLLEDHDASSVSPPTAPPGSPPAAADWSPSTPSSGERSPPFRANRARADPIEPTRGQRIHLFKHDNGHWKFARTIGSVRGERGAPWKANWLLVRVSAANTIKAQLVAKWVCPPIDEPEEAENEIKINELLQSANCTHLLPWHGSSKRNKRKRIIDEENEPEPEYFMPGPDGKKKHVSEHFIWYVVGELAKGLSALKTGRCSSSDNPVEPVDNPEPTTPRPDSNWAPILHNDIKDLNIMIVEGNAKYPTYPRILLFDFGLSKVQNSNGLHETVDGTIRWTPPESPPGYVPHTWPCSEKSDVWSVGIAAWQLMQATRGVDAFDQYLFDKVQQFRTDPKFFTGGVLKPGEGLFPTSLSDAEMPTEYSVDLCRFVKSCLQYHPEGRPDVATLLQTAEQRLALLDRTHRHEFSNTKQTILDEFRPEYGPDEKFSAFSIGEKFERPAKRRRVDIAAEDRFEYDVHINEWKNENEYPRPSRQTQLESMEGIRAFFNSKRSGDENYAQVWAKYDDDTDALPANIAWRHLYSTICKEIDPTAKVYDFAVNPKPRYNYAFTNYFKITCLHDLLDHVLPPFLENENWSEHRDALRALEHALQWGLMLLRMRGEPTEPLLEDMTAMHRAVADWVLVPESGIDYSQLQNDQGHMMNYDSGRSSDEFEDEQGDELDNQHDDELDGQFGDELEDELDDEY